MYRCIEYIYKKTVLGYEKGIKRHTTYDIRHITYDI
jgi:hypothetical protein